MPGVRAESTVPGQPPVRRRWRLGPHFDRWALLAVVLLQAAILLLRHDTRRSPPPLEAATAPEGAPAPATAAPWSRAPERAAVPTHPARFAPHGRSAPARMPVSTESAHRKVVWQSLRQTPTLDLRECPRTFTVLLSVPSRPLGNPAVDLVGRRLDVEIPLSDWQGRPAGRLFRQVLLPGDPDPDATPAMILTNGILRVRIAKAPAVP